MSVKSASKRIFGGKASLPSKMGINQETALIMEQKLFSEFNNEVSEMAEKFNIEIRICIQPVESEDK